MDLALDPVGGPVRAPGLYVLTPSAVVVHGDLGLHGDWEADVRNLWKHGRTVSGYLTGGVASRSPTTLGAHLGRALSAPAAAELRPSRQPFRASAATRCCPNCNG